MKDFCLEWDMCGKYSRLHWGVELLEMKRLSKRRFRWGFCFMHCAEVGWVFSLLPYY